MKSTGRGAPAARTSASHRRICIFCQRKGEETGFSREHLIPRNIGGALFLDDYVCKDCNDWLGSNVDTEIVRLPETLASMDALGLPHDRDGYLRRYYNLVGELNGAALRGVISGGRSRFPTQKLDDGSLLVPDERLEEHLTKIGARAGLPAEDVRTEVRRLLAATPEGPPVASRRIGVSLRRRTGRAAVALKPKRPPLPERELAKIAYEFLFLVLGRELFHPENDDPCNRLINTIGSFSGPKAAVVRLQPPSAGYEPLHVIHFRNSKGFVEMRVLLFGQIHFFVAPGRFRSVCLSGLQERFGSNIIGVQFQQRLDRRGMAFWGVCAEGPGVRLL
ncbi:MAG: HNH endonuclease [Acidobacteriia bacterium]|nr:HNH endonuclease [Terriglobia bacterium]